jgi:ornithine cyclodeaminase/alanine dehydrogenase-like protein (mu-crystallin family)
VLSAQLGEIRLLEKPGRTGDEEITVFKSVGLATEDLAVASVAYDRALEGGVRREI